MITIALGLRLLIWLTGHQVLPPSSDESIAMLMADQIRHGHFPLLFMAQPYMFPLESYLAAPLSSLPPGALASRLLALLMGLITTAMALRLVPREGSALARWLGGGLAVLPSVSVVILQGFYALPGYSVLMLISMAMPLLALHINSADRSWSLLALGLLTGLGFASHPLTLCASAPAWISLLSPAIGWNRNLRRWGWSTCGLLIGLLPKLLGRWTIHGAHRLATETLPLADIIERMWTVGPQGALPVALGLRPSFHPATKADPFILPINGFGVACGLALVLVIALLWRVAVHRRSPSRTRWPRWQLPDLLLATICLNVILFAAAPRAHSGASRYFTPTALALPLLLASMAGTGNRLARVTGLLAGGALLLAQGPTSWAVWKKWHEPDFALRVSVPDLKPALAMLRELNIRHAVASYGAAYRITYLSGGSITACQPRNERFTGWTLPYKKEVETAPRIAFVLTDSISFLKPKFFERDLRDSGLTAEVRTAGAFRIFFNFQQADEAATRQLDSSEITVIPPHLHPLSLPDGVPDDQNAYTLTWSNAAPLNHLLVYYAAHSNRASTMQLSLRQQGEWNKPILALDDRLQPLEFIQQQPRYGRLHQRIELGGVKADGIRLVSTCQRADRFWTIEAIDVYERTNPSHND